MYTANVEIMLTASTVFHNNIHLAGESYNCFMAVYTSRWQY